MEDKKNNDIEEVTMLIDPEEIDLTPDKFEKGIDEVSELAGKIAGLVMVGVPPVEALGYFIGLETMVHEKEAMKANIEIAKINADAQVKADAKISALIENRMM